jgi:hypothetical protein
MLQKIKWVIFCLAIPIWTTLVGDFGYVARAEGLKVDDASVDFYRVSYFSNPYYAPYDKMINRGANLNLNLSAWDVLFWKGSIDMIGDDTRLHEAGLTFRGGIHLYKWIDAIYMHRSEHLLDDHTEIDQAHFPQLDAYGISIHFLGREKGW